MTFDQNQEHRYPPGLEPTSSAISGPWQATDEMTAWRFCPVCGSALVASEYVFDDPRCSTCDRPFEACPCACVVKH